MLAAILNNNNNYNKTTTTTTKQFWKILCRFAYFSYRLGLELAKVLEFFHGK